MEIENRIGELLAGGLVADDPQGMLSELAGLDPIRDRAPQVRAAAEQFISKLFSRGKRFLETEPLKALVVGAFVCGLSMRDAESLCEAAGLGQVSKSTASQICKELRDLAGWSAPGVCEACPESQPGASAWQPGHGRYRFLSAGRPSTACRPRKPGS